MEGRSGAALLGQSGLAASIHRCSPAALIGRQPRSDIASGTTGDGVWVAASRCPPRRSKRPPQFRRRAAHRKHRRDANRCVRNTAGSATIRIFDDFSNQAQAFWGVYTTTPAIPPLGKFDLYYLGYENQRALYAQGVWGRAPPVDRVALVWNAIGLGLGLEALGQFGTFTGDIRAWTVSTSTGYTFSVHDWSIRLGLKADIASGDKNLSDQTLGTFNALFPKLGYLSSAALFAPSNITDIQPSITLKPLSNLTLTVGYDFIWRTTS